MLKLGRRGRGQFVMLISGYMWSDEPNLNPRPPELLISLLSFPSSYRGSCKSTPLRSTWLLFSGIPASITEKFIISHSFADFKLNHLT